MKPLLLLGGGGHCVSCIDVIEAEGKWRIRGIVDRDAERGSEVLGYPVLGTDENLAGLLEEAPSAIVAVGQIKSAAPRERLFEALIRAGAHAPVIASPRARISPHAVVGDGTIVMHGVLVNAAANVGVNCILNTHCVVEHGARIGNHCHVSTGAMVNGDARIGSGSFVGSGAVLREGVSIGEGCIVAAGAVVMRDLPAGSLQRRCT